MGEDVVFVVVVALVAPPELDRLLAEPVSLSLRVELDVVLVWAAVCACRCSPS